MWAAEKKAADFVAERPKAKIKQVAATTDDSSSRKNKRAARPRSEEKKDEELVGLLRIINDGMKSRSVLSSHLRLRLKTRKKLLLKKQQPKNPQLKKNRQQPKRSKPKRKKKSRQ